MSESSKLPFFVPDWSYIPIDMESKKPAIPWKQYQSLRADYYLITEWLKKGWSLGLVTGKVSGVVVVDDDRVKHGLNEWGFESEVISETRSGGKHYYFKYSEGVVNTANPEIHVDIRGEGGYVIIPPTKGYSWVKPPVVFSLDLLSEIPNEIKAVLYRSNQSTGKVRLTDHVALQEGSRNTALLEMANSLCNRYSEAEWTTAVLPILFGTNATYNPPLPEDEVKTIFNQATKFVKSHPKQKLASAPASLTSLVDERLLERELEKDAPSTGFYELDNLIKGFIPGHVYTLTGDTNVGKTALACNFAYNVAQQDRRVLYLALEPDTTVLDYFASIHLNKKFSELTEEDLRKDVGNVFVYRGQDVTSVDALMEAVRANTRFDLVVVDHASYFVRGGNNTTIQQSDMMKTFVQIAKENRTAIVLIQHPRKRTSSRENPMTEFEVSGSAAFFQDATDFLIVERGTKTDDETGSYEFTGRGWIKVLKSKSGRNGVCKVNFTFEKARIVQREEYEF